MLHFAKKIEDLRSPPGNRLELLKGKWSGFYSVRVNDQWRIVFQWAELGPSQVDVCDYHQDLWKLKHSKIKLPKPLKAAQSWIN